MSGETGVGTHGPHRLHNRRRPAANSCAKGFSATYGRTRGGDGVNPTQRITPQQIALLTDQPRVWRHLRLLSVLVSATGASVMPLKRGIRPAQTRSVPGLSSGVHFWAQAVLCKLRCCGFWATGPARLPEAPDRPRLSTTSARISRHAPPTHAPPAGANRHMIAKDDTIRPFIHPDHPQAAR